MLYQKISLPIDRYLEDILKKIQEFSTILIKASPGSGKTTRLPWYIAKNLDKKVYVLEPRRLAAKMAAERIAQEEGLIIGDEIGYNFRFENKTSNKTSLTFYTEGTFLKKALSDQELSGVDVVILDEFHERHLETDMALAFLLEVQSRKKDLKIILMSATLDTELLKRFQDATTVEIEAQNHPVEIHYLPNQPSVLNQNLEVKIRDSLEKIPKDDDVLIFLPGMREILKIQNYLEDRYGDVFILHSEVSKEEQDHALGISSKRKIILSTNIAESSVTIPGIKAVIDIGVQREAHYSPWNGLKIVTDKPVTKSSAIQRSGRAGRTSPGVCYRLYSLQDFENRDNFTLPEITRADLTDVFFQSVQFKHLLRWMTPPPQERWNKAKDLCFLMGVIDENSKLTPLAFELTKYPVGLRIARVMKAGEILPRDEKKQLLTFICQELENDTTGRLMRRLTTYLETKEVKHTSWEKCLISGFIDQVAKYRPKQNDLIHFSGKSIKLHPSLGTLQEGFYLVLDITQRQEAIKIISIEEDWLFDHLPFPFITEEQVIVNEEFALKSSTKLGSIVLDEQSTMLDWKKITIEQKAKILQQAEGQFFKRWNLWKEGESYNRYYYWHKIQGNNQLVDPKISEYFDYCGEMNWKSLEYFFKELTKENELNLHLPWSINLGGKKDLKIHYPFNQDPYIEAAIQDFYGLKESPKLGPNKLSLTLRLIGPHKRPLQVTKDLQGFWKKTYQEMIKEFKREYPRHHWPEDPENAPPILLKRQLNEN